MVPTPSASRARPTRGIRPSFDEPALLAYPYQCSDVVEQIDEQEDEDDFEQTEVQGSAEIELEERCAGMRHGYPGCGPGGNPRKNAEEGCAGNTEQDRAIDLARHQNESEHNAETGGDHFFRGEAAEAYEGCGIRDYELCVAQADEGDEHADAGGGRVLQAVRDAVDDLFADAGDGKQDEQDPGKEHDTQRRTPGDAHAQADGIGEVSVQRHAGGHRDGIISVKTHHE